MNHKWQRVINYLPNLSALLVNDEKVGFIYRPKNSKSDKNAWRVYQGIGDSARFVGHAWSQVDAQRMLESIMVGNVRGLNR